MKHNNIKYSYIQQLRQIYTKHLDEASKLKCLLDTFEKNSLSYDNSSGPTLTSRINNIIKNIEEPTTTEEVVEKLLKDVSIEHTTIERFTATVNSMLHKSDKVVKIQNHWYLSEWISLPQKSTSIKMSA